MDSGLATSARPGMTRSWRLSPRIPQAGGNAIDGDLDAAQHPLVRVLRAVRFEKLDLHMVERIKIREAVPHRALQEWVTLQQPVLVHDVEQRLDDEMPFTADAAKNPFAQGFVGHQLRI